MVVPARLYKYRAFNVNTLRLLSQDSVYYAQPSTFNDPLDCQPTIKPDLTTSEMEGLLTIMLEDAGQDAQRALVQLRAEADQYEMNDSRRREKHYAESLIAWIRDQLLSEFDSLGVLSLASTWDSALMWSHYSDSHRGICIEFDTEKNDCAELRAVNYSRQRQISMRDILAWKREKSQEALERIRVKFFAAKAPAWKYEHEWRDIRMANGESRSPFYISAIYFGLRCDPSVISTVASLLTKTAVAFYQVFTRDGSFKLNRRALGDRTAQPLRVRHARFAFLPSDDDDIPF